MAFQNPGGEIVLIMHNDKSADVEKTIRVNGKNLLVPMSHDSFNTIVVKI
jgi:O-glycosyl hydrolase